MMETPLPFSVLGMLIAGTGWFFWTGRQDRGSAIAAAEERARKAETATQAAMLDKTRAEARLAPLQDDLRRTDAALSASGWGCERLQMRLDEQGAALRDWRDVGMRRAAEVADLHATLAASYVRVGHRYLRYRADGVYPALGQVQADAGQATGASQNALEASAEVLSLVGVSETVDGAQHAPSPTRARVGGVAAEVITCSKCGQHGATFVCDTPRCPVNGGAAHG